jgi:pimeloyl-ACP methyl ester carboxylesterase
MVLIRLSLRLFLAITTFLVVSSMVHAQPVGPTFQNVRYGTHPRNLLDFYQASVTTAAPVVVFIHGGGYASGDKRQIRGKPTIQTLQRAGIHVAAINYRFVIGQVDPEPLPGPLFDCARAIQFLRLQGDKWKVDPQRIGAFGGSAGAAASLWLAFRQDLADPDNADPVKRQSSRLTCVAPINGPCSTDPRWLTSNMTGIRLVWFQKYLLKDYGARSLADLEEPVYRQRIEESSAMQHVDAQAPPVYMQYTAELLPIRGPGYPGGLIHCPLFGVRLKEKLDQLKVENTLIINRQPYKGGKDPYGSMEQFFIAKLTSGDLPRREKDRE